MLEQRGGDRDLTAPAAPVVLGSLRHRLGGTDRLLGLQQHSWRWRGGGKGVGTVRPRAGKTTGSSLVLGGLQERRRKVGTGLEAQSFVQAGWGSRYPVVR